MPTAMLTPLSNQTPAIVTVSSDLSGAVWVDRFPAQITTAYLTPTFRSCVDHFLAALAAGGVHHHITNAYRPKERAYLMHWAHKIYRNNFDPASVPHMDGVNIDWVHSTLEQSVNAAYDMVVGFDIAGLAQNTAPALNTLHATGEAIDMSIWWAGNVTLSKPDGALVVVDTLPRTGMNLQLKMIGASYGLLKFVGGNADRPHWSTTGH